MLTISRYVNKKNCLSSLHSSCSIHANWFYSHEKGGELRNDLYFKINSSTSSHMGASNSNITERLHALPHLSTLSPLSTSSKSAADTSNSEILKLLSPWASYKKNNYLPYNAIHVIGHFQHRLESTFVIFSNSFTGRQLSRLQSTKKEWTPWWIKCCLSKVGCHRANPNHSVWKTFLLCLYLLSLLLPQTEGL